MGKRGPAAQPVELQALTGRSHRPVDISGVFRPEVSAPPAPQSLLPESRKAWRRLMPELLRYNLVSQIDRDALAMLCQTIGRIELVERSIKARMALAASKGLDEAAALLDVTPNGLQVQGALYQVLKREQETLYRMLGSFGLRPDARANVSTAIRTHLDSQGQLDLAANGNAASSGAHAAPGTQPRSWAHLAVVPSA